MEQDTIKRDWVALDSSRHELIELTSVVDLVLDTLTASTPEHAEDTEAAVDALFVTRRELIRITDDLGRIATAWQESAGGEA